MNKKKELYNINKTVLVLTYGLFIIPILPNLIGNIIICVFVLSTLWSYFKNDDRRKRFNWSFFMTLVTVYICYITSLFYSENIDYAFKKLGTAVPLFLFPLAFSFLSNELIDLIKINLKNFIKVFVGTIVTIVIMIMIENINYINSFEKLHSQILSSGTLIGVEPLYLSLYISIALISCVYLYFLSKKVWKTILAIFLIIFLFTFLLILSFKSAIISFAVAFGLYALMVNKTKLWALFVASTIVVIGLLSVSVYFNKQFNKLLFVKADTDIQYAEIKSAIQSCSIELIPEAGIFGFGLGDGKDELINCYDGKNNALKQASYNSHNQYLSLFLNVGLIGLILFALTLFILLFTGLNNRNYLGIALLILFGVFMLAENILERQHGVVYFALFLCVLFIGNFKKPAKKQLVLSHEKVIDSFN